MSKRKLPSVRTLLRNLTDNVAAADSGRYALNCVLVEQLACVSTDGRRLIYAPHRADQDGLKPLKRPLLVHRETIKRFASIDELMPRTPVTVEDAGDYVVRLVAVIDGDRVAVESEMEAGSFPDWRAVVPAAAGPSVALDADYLAELTEFASRVQSSELRRSPVLRLGENADAAITLTDPSSGWSAMLMPVDERPDAKAFDMALETK